MQRQGQTVGRLRLADVLAALSLVTDLGMGHAPEGAMRACLLATTLARRIGLDETAVAHVYYTTLLKYVGCTAYAHEEAILFGGDDVAGRASASRVDFANPKEMLSFLLFDLARDSSPARRAAIVSGAMMRVPRMGTELERSHCEVARETARRLGLSPAVQQALHQMFERWDGKGAPHKLKGEDVALPARFAQVATQAVLFDRLAGPEAAREAIRRRSGNWLDPTVAAAFLEDGQALLAELAETDVRVAVVAAEPEPWHGVPESRLDDVARTFGDMTDLKLAFTRGHSSGVAELAEGAARVLGLADADAVTIRRAALLHDLGRVSVGNGVWETPGPLTTSQWEQIRLHAYHSERILISSPVLAPLAEPAGMHHERLDGSGYHRGAAAVAVPLSARILGAADAYQAMTQDRPHRPALSPEAAAGELIADADRGRLDADAVHAVLTAAGQGYRRVRRVWPAGLSDREVEVLRLIARGLTYRQIARELHISPKTAEHHIEHIYSKIDVSTRAAAAMFAMEHDLLPR